MADRIVEVEYLMADMAKSCCRGGNQNPLIVSLPFTPFKAIRLEYGDDDEIVAHCSFNKTSPSPKSLIASVAVKSKSMMTEAVTKLMVALSSGRLGQFRSQNSFMRSVTMKSGEVMPCESIWNPFCCAAEVCVDMMVEMIELMATGADWMTEMCVAMIDEVGKLADDIIKTEENIVAMGETIGEMADCIVVFIDQGLEFMTLFCPAQKVTYSLRGRVSLHQDAERATESEGCSETKTLFLKDAILTYSTRTIVTKLSSVIGERWMDRQNYHKDVMTWMSSLQSNPFGEFAAMVEVMMEAMNAFMKTMDSQTQMMNQMMASLSEFAKEEAKMSTMVIDMAGDVVQLETEVNTQEDLMVELSDCKSE
jgi:hypothetical protein